MQGPSTRTQAKLILIAVAALAWLTLSPPSARAQAAPQGPWLDQTKRAVILIAPCGAALCGNIEWLKPPAPGTNPPTTDIHNPDASLQNRPLCGLTMLGGFVPDGSGGWTGGWIYDPALGKTYKSVMHVNADGTLHVRGYIGIPMLGRTEIWTRPPAALPHCTVNP
jgi:uncharacterized protein (DUF2147 family)